MAEGRLRAVVATSSLDLGIDWGGVDQVIQVGAPKGVSRLLQRVGRANHRMDEPSRAILVPANRFEVLECEAAILGVAARELDGDPPRPGGLDVLAQHLLGLACSAPFRPDELYRRGSPRRALCRPDRAQDFDDVLRFVEDGGYALARLRALSKTVPRQPKGAMHVRSERVARQHRMNIGTIVEEPLLKVRLGQARRADARRGGGVFRQYAPPGDTFMFAGRLLRFVRLREHGRRGGRRAATASRWCRPMQAAGMPLTTNLADRVRGLLQDAARRGTRSPSRCGNGCDCSARVSRLPGRTTCWSRRFRAATAGILVAYCFEGRNAHQTLGMLLTRRMERARLRSRWASSPPTTCWRIWCARPPHDVARAVRAGHAGRRPGGVDGGSSMLRRTFRNVAVIAGLIERHHPGVGEDPAAGDGEQRPDLRRAAPPPARPHPAARDARGRGRRADRSRPHRRHARARAAARIVHMVLSRVSPLAVPVLLEIGRESVRQADGDDLRLEEAALIAEALGEAESPAAAHARGSCAEPRAPAIAARARARAVVGLSGGSAGRLNPRRAIRPG